MPGQSETTIPELPELDAAIYLLDDQSEEPGPLQSLVLDHILLHDAPGFWIDSGGWATTIPMARMAPSMHALDRINVARGFTPFQHYAICERLQAIEFPTDSLIILPEVDAMYRSDDPRGDEGQALLTRALAKIGHAARSHSVTVLMTVTQQDAFTDPVDEFSTKQLSVETTPLGPRFTSTEFDTLVYHDNEGWMQTTLQYWQQLLEARKSLHTVPHDIHATNQTNNDSQASDLVSTTLSPHSIGTVDP